MSGRGFTALKLRTWRFVASEAGQNIRRNPMMSLASISTATVSLLVLALFLLFSANLQNLGNNVENQLEIRAFFSSSVSSSHDQTVVHQVGTWPQVKSVQFIPKSVALQQMKKQYGQVLNGLGSYNPLLNAVSVKLKSAKDLNSVARRLGTLPGVTHVTYQQQVVQRLLVLVSVVRIGGLAVAVLLGLGALLIIHNAIRLAVFSRRREIAIMRLVGAVDGLIRWPFLLEGMFLGLGAAILAGGLAAFGYMWVYHALSRSLPFIPLVHDQTVFVRLGALLVLLGLVMGLIGSRLSLQRLLRI